MNEQEKEEYLAAWAFGVIRVFNVLAYEVSEKKLAQLMRETLSVCDQDEKQMIKKLGLEAGVTQVKAYLSGIYI